MTTTTPVRVALPNQPQGEAIAFTPGGDLLAGSESAGGPLPPLQVLPGAVDLTRNESWSGSSVSLSASTGEPAASDTTEASDSAGPDDGAAQWSTPSFSVVHSWPGSRRSASCGDARVPAGTDPSRRH